ncbi:NAD(P)-binding domain-containing protein [Nocardia sp. NBC_01009]|uniref:NAD(P)-binding domain-containing protein n=1 Tax=Nocardia sp. NBC_01009 TaxID=2975996 RepID=UPI00386D5197|nr:NAD(P)-binding domain-containing protein [Nocardia sp. NBC_01009]
MNESNTIAILGAGIMANTVANTLDTHGFELRRYNRTISAIEGPAIVCASPAQAAEGAAAVWSFVHDDAASRAVWFGEDGALATAHADRHPTGIRTSCGVRVHAVQGCG